MIAALETVETTEAETDASTTDGTTDVKVEGASGASETTDGTTDVKVEETSGASETTEVDNSGNRAAIETIEGAANKEATETTEETEVAVDVLPTVDNEVVEPSTTMTGPVPVATT